MTDLLNDTAGLVASSTSLDGVSTMATITGTAGNDSLVGTGGSDVFHMEQGGNDTVRGGADNDSFYFGDSFTKKDRISGDSGHGYDTLYLDGDYSDGVTFGKHTLNRIDSMVLTAGHSYAFDTGAYQNNAFNIDGSALGTGESLHVDASTFAGSNLGLHGGAGDDLLIGRAGTVVLDGGEGDNVLTSVDSAITIVLAGDGANTVTTGDNSDTIRMTSVGLDDHIDAGSTTDNDVLYVGTHGSDLSADNVQHVEQIVLLGGEVKVEAGFSTGRNTLSFQSDSTSVSLRFDGSAIVKGDLTVQGSSQSDTLIGGGGNNHLYGNDGSNTLIGGGGQDHLLGEVLHDKLVGGEGADILTGGGASDSFVYLSLADSDAGGVDEITDLSAVDVIDLKAIDADTKKAGNQAFHLVDDFTHHRGELMLSYDKDADRTHVLADVDGDGVADLDISADGKHLDFTNFVL